MIEIIGGDMSGLIKSLKNVKSMVADYSGRDVDVKNTPIFVPDGMGADRITQTDEKSSAEEKIKFIQENPEVDRWLQGLRNDIQRAFI